MHGTWGKPKGMEWVGKMRRGATAEAFLEGQWRQVHDPVWLVGQGVFKVRTWGDHYCKVRPEFFRCQGVLFVDGD